MTTGAQVDTPAPTMVRRGQIIGFTTLDGPIRFELWRCTDDAGFVPIAPEPQMSTWLVLSERDPHPSGAPRIATTPAITKIAA